MNPPIASTNPGDRNRFKGKSDLVTGGAAGMGLAAARMFAAEGPPVSSKQLMDREIPTSSMASANNGKKLILKPRKSEFANPKRSRLLLYSRHQKNLVLSTVRH